MTRIIILLCCIFGLVAGEAITKEYLTQRLYEIDQLHLSVIANFTAHGMEYFARELKTKNFTATCLKDLPNTKPEEFWKCQQDIERSQKFLDDPFKQDYKGVLEGESYKAKGLYYAAMKRAENNSVEAEAAKKQTADIITAQVNQNGLTICRAQGKEAKNDVGDIHYMMIQLSYRAEMAETIYDFFRLEYQTNEQIRMLVSLGKTEAAKKRKDALKVFLEVNYQLNKIFPIDSQFRMEQYLEVATEHYRQFKFVYDLIHTSDTPPAGCKRCICQP